VDDMGPVVDASRFDAGGSWRVPPEPWADQVDDRVIAAKIAAQILTPRMRGEFIGLYRRWRADEARDPL